MQIKTYKGKHLYQPHFFILNKGGNCGKPLVQPCANCFVVLATNEQQKDFYYWLCFALWQAGKFEPYLRGSAIAFIHVHDAKALITQAAQAVQLNPGKFANALKLMATANEQCYILQRQLQLLEQAKGEIFRDIL